MRRRLLQRLQQRVEGRGRKHVHFVDDVDLVAGLGRGIAHAVQQLAHLVDLAARGRVQLEDIEVSALEDGPAMPSLDRQVCQVRLMDGLALIVEGPGQQARRGGLADAADAGEHEGVGDTPRSECVGQGPDHALLTDQVFEGLRPVLSSDDGVGGRRPGLAEHVRGRFVPSGGFRLDHGVSHRAWIGRLTQVKGVETGRRPGVDLVTAASFRT